MPLRFVPLGKGKVFSGRVNGDDTMFVGPKTDVTVDFEMSLVQKGLHNNGQFVIKLADGYEYSVTVTEVDK